jgi:glutathione peroxidase
MVTAAAIAAASLSLALLASPTPPAPAAPPAAPAKPAEPAADTQLLKYTVKDIDGKDFDLAQLKGKVVMIVNVASQCGLTKQYEGLQRVYDQYKDKGLVIVGFPANNFMGQEPGTNEEIKAFCTGKYSVTFPMMAKISVKGEDQHPLYKQIASLPAPLGGDPAWNFAKVLTDREGHAAARFDPRTKPDDEAVIKKIEELLGAEKKQ